MSGRGALFIRTIFTSMFRFECFVVMRSSPRFFVPTGIRLLRHEAGLTYLTYKAILHWLSGFLLFLPYILIQLQSQQSV